MDVSERNLVMKIEFMFFGWGLGIRSLLKADYKIALKRLMLPVNYWRASIFSHVASFLAQAADISNQSLKILDVGSPKLLSLFLAAKTNCSVYATDLQDQAIYTEWQKHYKNMSTRNNVCFEFADVKSLNYPNEYFDIAYSLSVIHMVTPADTGDIMALKELQKKVKRGGYLIIEVPLRDRFAVNFAHRSNFEERYEGEPLFRERQYDEAALEKRLSANISGDLVHRVVLRERLPFERVWGRLDRTLTTACAFLEPWADLLNITEAVNKHEERSGKSVILCYKIRK